MFRVAGTIFVLLLALSCSGEKKDSIPPEPAFLGVHVTPLGGPGQDPSLAQAYLSVHQGSFAVAQFEIGWGEAEPYLGVRDWSKVNLHAIQARQRGIPLSCILLVIDNQTGFDVTGHLPVDLVGREWDEGWLRFRLTYFVRELEEKLRPNLSYLWIGREVDAYLAQNLGEIHPFLQLVRECRDSLAVTAPNVKVGTILSYGEAEEDGRLWLCDSLANGIEWLGVTVYGRNRDYVQDLDPAGAILRVREAVSAFGRNRVVLSEVGYPGAVPATGAQDAFGSSLLALLADPPANLQGAFWYCLHDWPPSEARAEALRKYSGEPARAENYRIQLMTLGALEQTGVAKPVWATLRDWSLAHPNRGVAAERGIMQ